MTGHTNNDYNSSVDLIIAYIFYQYKINDVTQLHIMMSSIL